MKTFQVQILVGSDWYGFSEDYNGADPADVKRVVRLAKKFGWTTRVIEVLAD